MRIAFYAPLKSPNHGVPSGDRLMARQLVAALEMAGHSVEVASELRGFTVTPEPALRAAITEKARAEIAALLSLAPADRPELWLTYHPYYKTPDQIGPAVARAFGIPYVTAEASYSTRQDSRGWAANQRLVADAVQQAIFNLCFTARDRRGLVAAIPDGVYEPFPPFIDPGSFQAPVADAPHRLVTVAMMRGGDKLESYAMLARSLALLAHRPWTLTVIGDGPKLSEVKAMFAGFDQQRITWLGQRSTDEIAGALADGGIYVWPGCGEAYGL
ncbi:MAG: glycosyltransferase family 1 protein, partial [Rhizobium sp.]